jgi:hypothetical protein
MNCFRYLKLVSPLNAAICTTTYLERQKCYRPGKKILFKTIIWPWGQSPTKVITVRDTPPYGHAPTYQISLTYLERQKCYGPDKKILFTKQLFDLEVKGQGPTKVITVRDTLPYGHAPTYQISLTYLERQKLWSGQASLRSGRKNQTKTICLPSFELFWSEIFW